MARFKKSTEVQTILFDKSMWTVTAARKWLKDHGYKVPAVDTTKEYHRFRQRPTFHFKKGTFRTKKFGSGTGIRSVIAVPRTIDKKKKEVPRKPYPDKESLKKKYIRIPKGPHKPPWPPRKNPVGGTKKPWLPALLIDLAIPISIDLESGEQLRFPLSGKFAMAANRAGTEIWILSKSGSKNVRATDDKGEKLYEKFTGFEHDDVAKLVKIKPRSMSRIGRAVNIVYRSDKFSKPGDTSNYVHSFSHYPTVSVDNARRPSIVALRGGRIKIKKEGITG